VKELDKVANEIARLCVGWVLGRRSDNMGEGSYANLTIEDIASVAKENDLTFVLSKLEDMVGCQIDKVCKDLRLTKDGHSDYDRFEAGR
jgi:hypothetical protein